MGWDTFPASGIYTVRVTARNTSGQEQEVRAHVTVDNTVPQLELLSPQEGDVFSLGNIQIRAHAAAETLDRVDFYVDGKLIAQRRTPPFEVEWLPRATGVHTIFIVAYNKAVDHFLNPNQVTTPQVRVTIVD